MIVRAFMIVVILIVAFTIATYGVPPGLVDRLPGFTAPPAPQPPPTSLAPFAPAPAPAVVQAPPRSGTLQPAKSGAAPTRAPAWPPEPACQRHEDTERNHVTITC